MTIHTTEYIKYKRSLEALFSFGDSDANLHLPGVLVKNMPWLLISLCLRLVTFVQPRHLCARAYMHVYEIID